MKILCHLGRRWSAFTLISLIYLSPGLTHGADGVRGPRRSWIQEARGVAAVVKRWIGFGEASSIPRQKSQSNCETGLLENRAHVEQNKFSIGRGLDDYRHYLGVGSELDRLATSGGHWIDMGAGLARAQIGFFHSHPKADFRLTAVGVGEIPYTRDLWSPEWESRYRGRFQYRFGYVEGDRGDVRAVELDHLPKAQLITDYFGPLSYTDRPDVVLAKYFDLLAEDGVLAIVMKPAYTRILGAFALVGESNMIALGQGSSHEGIELVAWIQKSSPYAISSIHLHLDEVHPYELVLQAFEKGYSVLSVPGLPYRDHTVRITIEKKHVNPRYEPSSAGLGDLIEMVPLVPPLRTFRR